MKKAVVGVSLLFFLVLSVKALTQEVSLPPEELGNLTLAVKVEKQEKDETILENAEGADLFAGDKTFKVDGTGVMRIEKLKPGRLLLGAEKIEVIKRLFQKTRIFRYVVADTVDIKPGENSKELELELVEVLDDYCLRCHPPQRQELWQVARDRHPSGVPLPGPYEERFEASGLKLNKAGMVGCETCHTIHANIGNRHLLWFPLENSVLCLKCH